MQPIGRQRRTCTQAQTHEVEPSLRVASPNNRRSRSAGGDTMLRGDRNAGYSAPRIANRPPTRGLCVVMNWLLLFVPAAIGLEGLAPDRHLLVFLTSSIAILPLAGRMGQATEHLAERMGEGVGGLLNATFGNAAELIIALVALRAGLHDVVKASIAGCIVGEYLAGARRRDVGGVIPSFWSSTSIQWGRVPRRRCAHAQKNRANQHITLFKP